FARARPFWLGLLSLLCGGLLWQLARVNAWDLQPVIHGPFSLARSLPEFVIGMLAYRVYRSGRWPRFFRTDSAFAVTGATILALCVIVSSDLAIVALLPALLLAASVNAGRVRAALNGRVIGFLGEISYSLYMIHYFCIGMVIAAGHWFDASPSNVAMFVTSLCVSVALATVVSRGVEYPARALLRDIPLIRSPARSA
ncbi:MAG TPA: acyltransferase family protein, partial [Stellaceae bacterium]